MRPGTKAELVRRLREQAMATIKAADDLENAAEGPPFRFGVGWAPKTITIDDRVVPLADVEELAARCIWALYESQRPGDDPSCERTFDAVMASLMTRAGRLCNQYTTHTKDGASDG